METARRISQSILTAHSPAILATHERLHASRKRTVQASAIRRRSALFLPPIVANEDRQQEAHYAHHDRAPESRAESTHVKVDPEPGRETAREKKHQGVQHEDEEAQRHDEQWK